MQVSGLQLATVVTQYSRINKGDHPMSEANTAQAQPENQAEFVIQKVYFEDTSFESPNSPIIFKEEWSPEANIDLNTESKKLDDNTYQVALTVTVTAKSKDKTAFVAEVKQSGIFTVTGIDNEEQMGQILGAYCPSTLFPYARETISGLVNRGGFPQLNLAPINFDALYAQGLAQSQQDGADQVH